MLLLPPPGLSVALRVLVLPQPLCCSLDCPPLNHCECSLTRLRAGRDQAAHQEHLHTRHLLRHLGGAGPRDCPEIAVEIARDCPRD